MKWEIPLFTETLNRHVPSPTPGCQNGITSYKPIHFCPFLAHVMECRFQKKRQREMTHFSKPQSNSIPPKWVLRKKGMKRQIPFQPSELDSATAVPGKIFLGVNSQCGRRDNTSTWPQWRLRGFSTGMPHSSINTRRNAGRMARFPCIFNHWTTLFS